MQRDLAVVTGGNRGIGLETCRELAARGLDVILTSRDPGEGERVAAGMTAGTGGGRVQARPLDVADARSVAAFAERLVGERASVAVLVNNAGVSLRGFDADLAARTLEVNYFGAARVTDALLPLVPRGGRVVMVSSGMGELAAFGAAVRARFTAPDLDRAGLDALVRSFVDDVRRGEHERHGWPGNAYRVSKAAMNALVRLLAPTLGARGVLVNAVCPGWVRTDLGGPSAPRSLDQGAASVVWTAMLPPDGQTGGFFRDGRSIPW